MITIMLPCLLPALLTEKLRHRVEEGPARHWQSKEFRSPGPDLSPLLPIPSFINLITHSFSFLQVNQDHNQVQQVLQGVDILSLVRGGQQRSHYQP